jgi:hypothetical protein
MRLGVAIEVHDPPVRLRGLDANDTHLACILRARRRPLWFLGHPQSGFHALLRREVNILFEFRHTLRVEDLHPAGTAKLRLGSGEFNGELSRGERQITGSSLDRYEPFLSRARFDGNDLLSVTFSTSALPRCSSPVTSRDRTSRVTRGDLDHMARRSTGARFRYAGCALLLILVTQRPAIAAVGQTPWSCSIGLSDRQTHSVSGGWKMLHAVCPTPHLTISRTAPLSTATPCAKYPWTKSLSCSNRNGERPSSLSSYERPRAANTGTGHGHQNHRPRSSLRVRTESTGGQGRAGQGHAGLRVALRGIGHGAVATRRRFQARTRHR